MDDTEYYSMMRRQYSHTEGSAKKKFLNMNNYRQYHDETGRFFYETMVYFSQCNTNKKMSLHTLLKLTSDAAVEDFNLKYMSRDVLTEKGIAILVSRCSFRVHKYPEENQHVVLSTWEEKSEALQFVRAYEIRSVEGEKLISGLSTWLLVDLNTRRLMPVKKFDEMGLREPTDLKTDHDLLPCGKITLSENACLLGERTICYSDLDANGHTNNSRYAAFAVDALPPEYRSKDFTDFRINFSKEAMVDEKLQLYADILDSENKIVVVGKTAEAVSFEAELYW